MRVVNAVLLAGLVLGAALPAAASTWTVVTPSWKNLDQLNAGEGQYQLWLVGPDSLWTSFGKFNMDQDGQTMLDGTTGQVITSLSAPGDHTDAVYAVISVELTPDPDPANPNHSHVLGGTWASGSATMSVSHPKAIGLAFGPTQAFGQYLLDTPSDDCVQTTDDFNSGVWFFKPTSPLTPSLTMPTLPAEWEYESWIGDANSVDQIPYSCGEFVSMTGADFDGVGTYTGHGECGNSDTYAPKFPGEDFVAADDPNNPKYDPTRPVLPQLNDGHWLIVISMEPVPNPGPSPFHELEPLVQNQVPNGLHKRTLSGLVNNSTLFPQGTLTMATAPVKPATWGTIKALEKP